MEFWGYTRCGIWVSDLGNVRDLEVTIHKGHRTVRKNVTIDGATVKKRFQVAKLVLECFPYEECPFQAEGLGNHEGKGTAHWDNGNELDDRACNLCWVGDGPGWTTEQMVEKHTLQIRAMDKLKLVEQPGEEGQYWREQREVWKNYIEKHTT